MKKTLIVLILSVVSTFLFAELNAQERDKSAPNYRYVIDVTTTTENGVTTKVTTYYYPNIGKTTKDVETIYNAGAISHSAENHYKDTKESNFRSWNSKSVLGIYKEVFYPEIDKYGYDESFISNNKKRYFKKVNFSSKIFDISLYEQVDINFWKIHNTNYFIKFSSSSFKIHKGDAGKLDWKGSSGTFYKK